MTFVLAPSRASGFAAKDGVAEVAARPSGLRAAGSDPLLDTVGGPVSGIGLEGSVRGIDSARAIPVLFLTTEGQEALVMRAKKAHAKGWLVKPVKPEMLVKAVRAVAR